MRFLLPILILLLPIAYAFYVLPDLPAQIPTHFGINGNPDAWGSKETIFLAPGILCGVGLFLFILFQNLGKVDPKFSQNPDNSAVFTDLSYGITGFLSILAIMIVEASSNPAFQLDRYLFSFIGISFAIFGKYMPRLQPNYFAGFRLPWTLENPANWKYTHELAGTFWFYGGLLQALLCFWTSGPYAFAIFMSILLVQILVPIIFSYNFYRKNKN